MDNSPESMRAICNTSSINFSKCWPAPLISNTLLCCLPGGKSSSNNWAKPKMAFNGVLSSWLVRDKNMLLDALASSASFLACMASLMFFASNVEAWSSSSDSCPISSRLLEGNSNASPRAKWPALSRNRRTRLTMVREKTQTAIKDPMMPARVAIKVTVIFCWRCKKISCWSCSTNMASCALSVSISFLNRSSVATCDLNLAISCAEAISLS